MNTEYRTSFHIVPQPGTPFTAGPETLQPEDVYEETESVNPAVPPQDGDEIIYNDWERPGVVEFNADGDYVTNNYVLDAITDVAVIENDSCTLLSTRADDDLVAPVIRDSTS